MPYQKCNSVNIYYNIIGSGRKLVLVNGLGGDTRSWELLLPHLKDSFEVLYFDLRGAGKSDKPDGPYTIDQMANETAELISQLKFEGADVLGFSMGGLVAQTIAIKHPEIFDKLILVSTTPAWGKPFPFDPKAVETFDQTEATTETITAVFNIIFGKAYREKVSVEEYINFRMTDPEPQPVEAYLSQLAACKTFDLLDHIAEIQKPTIVIAGSDDHLITPKNAQWLHENIKDSQINILDKIGHMVPIEAPAQLAETLLLLLA